MVISSLSGDEFDDFQDLYPSRKNTKFSYPLLHTSSLQTPISDFFTPSSTAPNIVIIIVESLGRYYSGANAEFGSFTP